MRMPFVRWLMAEDSFRSWSRMAALILFAFVQFRFDRLLVLAECGFQHLAGTLLLRFRFLL
jgi:hypothetical protein